MGAHLPGDTPVETEPGRSLVTSRRERGKTTPTTSSPTNRSGLTETELRELLADRHGGLKSALMDQQLVAGIGNIYSDEILFQSRLHPKRPARDLDAAAYRRLHRQLRRVLRTAIDAIPPQTACHAAGCWVIGRTAPLVHEATAKSGDLRPHGRGVFY